MKKSDSLPRPSGTAHLYVTYISLLVLLALTFWLAHVKLGNFSAPVALLIATAKMLLVALIFMELKEQSGIHRVAAGLGLFWLGILMTLSLSDYISRNWMPMPGHWPSDQIRHLPPPR